MRCPGVCLETGTTSCWTQTRRTSLEEAPMSLKYVSPEEDGWKNHRIESGTRTNDPGCIVPADLPRTSIGRSLADRSLKCGRRLPIRGGLCGHQSRQVTLGVQRYIGRLPRERHGREADLFISLHNDWNRDQSVSGTYHITSRTLNWGRIKRQAVAKHLTMHLGTVDKGVGKPSSPGSQITRHCS